MNIYVDNTDADVVVRRVQSSRSSADYQLLMDMISGVDGYTPSDMSNQGSVGAVIRRELSRTPNVEEAQELVSVFWEGVLVRLDDAAATGTTVDVCGERRGTRMNGVYWLRKQGAYAVRNFLNSRARSILVQTCGDCGMYGAVAPRTDAATACAKCSSSDTAPTAHRSANTRRCSKCGHVWSRRFVRLCRWCQSTNVSVTMRSTGDQIPESEDESAHPGLAIDAADDEAEYQEVMNAIYTSLPKDPSDPTRKTQTYRVLEVLTDRQAAQGVCQTCREKTPRDYDKCESREFRLGECNYSKKLGLYLGCTPILANRRVDKIREVAMACMRNMAGSNSIARNALRILGQRRRAVG